METMVLNIIPSGVLPVCHVSQNDNDRTIRIKLYDGNNPYSIKSEDVITLHIRKPDGNTVSSDLEYSAGNSFIDIDVSDYMCDVDGKNLCELRIINGSTRIGTSNFYMFVELDPSFVPTPPTPAGRRGGLKAQELVIISTTYEILT